MRNLSKNSIRKVNKLPGEESRLKIQDWWQKLPIYCIMQVRNKTNLFCYTSENIHIYTFVNMHNIDLATFVNTNANQLIYFIDL